MSTRKFLTALSLACILGFTLAPVHAEEIDTHAPQPVETEAPAASPAETDPAVEPDDLGHLAPDAIQQVLDTEANLDTLGDRIIAKIYDVANILQRMALPVAVIFFFAGAALTVWGAMSKRATILPGVMTCAAAVVAYALCAYAPQIIVWASGWLAGG